MLKGILSISGQPGLFKMVAEARNKIIVESLITGKRMPASPTAKISSLEDIAIFTESGDMPLKKVLKLISEHENGGAGPDAKAAETRIKGYFSSIIPDYDQERVYVSDLRKILAWYNLLLEKELLDFTEEEEGKSEEEDSPEKETSPEEEGSPSE